MSESPQLNIFDVVGLGDIGHRLATVGRWPDQGRFPVNLPGRTVREKVLEDLKASANPLIVTGYASLDRIIDLLAGVGRQEGTHVRLVLGNEPFESRKKNFVLANQSFPDQVRDYWLERGISLYLSAQLLFAIECIKAGRVEARFIDDAGRGLHAKIYVGDRAATLGSSNFTQAGLSSQLECNVRFAAESDKRRFAETVSIAEHYWSVGRDFTPALLSLLEALLRVVSWEEALARACAQLLEGEWASRYLQLQLDLGDTRLWPSQQAGIAQALWVIENIGSVLVADATGSGKTRMGAHLLRALRDRIWSAGRTRSDLSMLICPPAVQDTWRREAVNCGLALTIGSHGMLSKGDGEGYEDTTRAVRRAQTLAVDEAHNFLNLRSSRTQEVLSNIADNIVLFTATPINRGASDLLSLVDMLGADNMEQEALDVLEALSRRKGNVDMGMGPTDVAALPKEIQRFTVRRTKTALNALIDREPGAYTDAKGKPCRYPRHLSRTYDPAETRADREVASEIRRTAQEALGLALLEDVIEMPQAYAEEGWSEETFLRGRLSATRHLALHNIMATLRSSRAALVEHLVGTTEAMQRFGIRDRIKQEDTGNAIGKLRNRLEGGRPKCQLSCKLPDWLDDDELFRQACAEEVRRYETLLRLVLEMSPAREVAKAGHLRGLIGTHRLVLAFDSRLISLEVIRGELLRLEVDAEIIVATGADAAARKRVRTLFGRDSTSSAIALCSDSMSEGVNLQGASAIVHLDMPTVVRIAEQRVGRVDRMDSPHVEIEAWWPDDSAEFAIRSDERFVQRYQTVETLLGSNLPLPASIAKALARDSAVVRAADIIHEVEEALGNAPWDGIQDAFAPVRDLISGPRALVPDAVYTAYRDVDVRVLSRVSLVRSASAWAFFAVSGSKHGAPKWVFIEQAASPVASVRLDDVCGLLRDKLTAGVQEAVMDAHAVQWLQRFLKYLGESERKLLPRKKQRALELAP